MKTALVNGIEVQAAESAPPEATCPACGDPVELRVIRGIWHYRHRRGAGRGCPLRERPRGLTDRKVQRELIQGDGYITMVVDAAIDVAKAAQRGNLSALLSVAFSPVVRLGLQVLGLDPDVAIPRFLRRLVGDGDGGMKTVITTDVDEVIRLVEQFPGPVFDLRPSTNGRGAELEALEYYVPLVGIHLVALPYVLEVVREWNGTVYVIGEEKQWEEIQRRAQVQAE